jgi:hypothetical protein
MGLLRKMTSLSTLGGVKYTSRREAETKERLAAAKLSKAQARQAAAGVPDPAAAKWEPVVASIEAGEASWDDLSRSQKMSMPIGYQLRCKTADRRRQKEGH